MKRLRRYSAQPLFGLSVVLLGAPLLSTSSWAQPPSEKIAQVLEQVEQLTQVSNYEEASRILEERLAQNEAAPDNQIALKNALADVHYRWAMYFSTLSVPDYQASIRHLQAAYESDKVLRRAEAGRDLGAIGGAYYNQNNYEQTFKYWNQMLDVEREINNRPEEAHTLVNLALVCRLTNRREEALGYYKLAVDINRELKDLPGQAWTLNVIATLYADWGRHEEAIDYGTQSLSLCREIKNRELESQALRTIGVALDTLGRREEALNYFHLKYSVDCELKDIAAQAWTLGITAAIYYYLKRYTEAWQYTQLQIGACRAIKDRGGEAAALRTLGNAAYYLGRPLETLEDFRQSLPITRDIKDRGGEAYALNVLAMVSVEVGGNEEAVRYGTLALPISREIKNREFEAWSLRTLGIASNNLGRHEEALNYFKLELPIRTEREDTVGEAWIFRNREVASNNLGYTQDALAQSDRALAIARGVKYQQGEVWTLTDIGSLNLDNGRPKQALEFLAQALPVAQDIKDRDSEARILIFTGIAYGRIGRNEDALEQLQRALALAPTLPDRGVEALALSSLAAQNLSMGHPGEALKFANLAFDIYHKRKEPPREVNLLCSLSDIYLSLEQFGEAAQCCNKALLLAEKIKFRSGKIQALANLMRVYEAQKQPALAIVFGKQSVNVIQSIRRDNPGLNQEFKSAYLKSNSSIYQFLARLLIESGRFVEAREVVSMLQQQEFFDSLGSGARTIQMESQKANFLGNEATTVGEQNRKVASIVALSKEEEQLVQRPAPTTAEKVRLAEVKRLLQQQSEQLASFFAALPRRFPRVANDVQKDVTAPQSIDGAIKGVGGKAAYIWSFADDKGLALLVTLSVGPKLKTFNFSFKPDKATLKGQSFTAWFNTQIEELNRSIAKRQNVDKGSRQLYDVLFCRGQLEKELHEAGVNTILWRLTGSLRSIPLAALRDKDGYLIEKYANVVLTAGSSAENLAHAPRRDWKVLGAGVSKSRVIDGNRYEPLPGVLTELRAVVRDPQDGFTTGILPGKAMYDDKFTVNSFFRALGGGSPQSLSPYQVVHIASHCKISSDALQSFLLTGDARPLTFADLQNRAKERNGSLFRGVELVTLSACDTAKTVGDDNGQGADSLAALVELNGAKAVLGTLWPVADEQTASVMTDFYRLHKTEPSKGKAWALQQAQLKMLKRGGVYSHPYYWAPFTLMGNGK